MTPLEEVVQRLEAERYGPVVHDPVRIPHIPLAAYDPELFDEVIRYDEEEARAVQAWRERQARRANRERQRRAEKKRRRAMTEDEIEHAG